MLIRRKICTDRLRLEPLARNRVEALHELLAVPEVGRWLLDGRVPTREEVMALAEDSDRNFAHRGFGLWLVFDGDEFVGFVGLREPTWEPGAVELMYGLFPQFWGRGYATEAARAVLGAGFSRGLQRIVAAADVPNEASARVLTRLGMSFDRAGELDGIPMRFYSVEAKAFAGVSARSA